MNTATLFRRMLTIVGLSIILQLLPTSAVQNSCAQQEQRFAAMTPAPAKATKRTSIHRADRASITILESTKNDKITSFFVRANDSKRIQLSMLIVHKEEFTQAVRALVGKKVTPLMFSISTLPNRTVYFDPAFLRFEQNGRVWQPRTTRNAIDILPAEEGAEFGGTITESQVQQAVILLPEWFDPQAPITLRYRDFHYLAQFSQATK